MSSLVSIIMPVYNKIYYMNNAVNSVLMQTYTNWELLLIDDGSTDGSGEVCNQYAEADNRVKVFHSSNRGVGAARNLGIEKAAGEYLVFADADDRLEENMIGTMVCIMKKTGTPMAACSYTRESGKTELFRNHMIQGLPEGKKTCETAMGVYLLKHNILGVVWNKMFRKEYVTSCFEERFSLCEDSIFTTQYYLNHPGVVTFSGIGYHYRNTSESSLSRRYQKNGLPALKEYFLLNVRLTHEVGYSYRVFFYGVYTFLFETLVNEPLSIQEKLVELTKIAEDNTVRKAIGINHFCSVKERVYQWTIRKRKIRLLLFALEIRRSVLRLRQVGKGKK